MFAVPKELYFHVMDRATDNQKHSMGEINVDQVNVACGPLYAGQETVKMSPDTEGEPPQKNAKKENNDVKVKIIPSSSTAHSTSTAQPLTGAVPVYANGPKNVPVPETQPVIESKPVKTKSKSAKAPSAKKKTTSVTSSPPPVPKITVSKPTQTDAEPSKVVPDTVNIIPSSKTSPKGISDENDVFLPAFDHTLTSTPKRGISKSLRSAASSFNNDSRSAESEVESQIFGDVLDKSVNPQEIEEVLKSASKQGKPAAVKAIAGKFNTNKFYGGKSTKASSSKGITTRSVSDAQAKQKRDALRVTGVTITSPERKKKPKYV